MQRSDLIDRHWHELTKAEKKFLRDSGVTIHWLVENILQPPWCDYPKTLICQYGCWSLMGNRIQISEEFCSSGICGYYVLEKKRYGYGGYTRKQRVV